MLLLWTQEYKKFEQFSPNVDGKIKAVFQDFIWDFFKKIKLDSVINSNHFFENIQGFHGSKVNPEIARSFDLKSQNIQNILLNTRLVNIVLANKLFRKRSKKSYSVDTDTAASIIKSAFKHCAFISMLLQIYWAFVVNALHQH